MSEGRNIGNGLMMEVERAFNNGDDWRYSIRCLLARIEDKAWEQGYLAGVTDAWQAANAKMAES